MSAPSPCAWNSCRFESQRKTNANRICARQKLGWHFGKLTRFFDAATTPRYAALYNFDVLFTGQKGPVGMKLEANGAKTRYYTDTAEEGAWSFVTPS